MEGREPPPSHWISATFTTAFFGRPTPAVSSSGDTADSIRKAWLTSSQYTPILVSCLPDMYASIWVDQFELCRVGVSGGSGGSSWPTPPQSPERALKDAEDGISRLLLAASPPSATGLTGTTAASATGEREECDRSFRDFMSDVVHRLRLRGCHLLVALVLLERLRASRHLTRHPSSLTAKCGAQAYIFCLLLAHKISEDRAYDNKTWAHLTRYSVSDINKMEGRLLGLLDHELFVSERDLVVAFERMSERYHFMDSSERPRRSSRGL